LLLFLCIYLFLVYVLLYYNLVSYPNNNLQNSKAVLQQPFLPKYWICLKRAMKKDLFKLLIKIIEKWLIILY